MLALQLREDEYSKFPVINPKELREKELTELSGFNRLIMLDRYSVRDTTLDTLRVGDLVVVTVKDDSKYPLQGYGHVKSIKGSSVAVKLDYPEEFEGTEYPTIIRHISQIYKPLETYWEQICYRVAKAVAGVESTKEKQYYWFEKFYYHLKHMHMIPGGRILNGAGTDSELSLFNCFVLPGVKDSRQGIIEHIGKATEIMSRGGGVGTNISTLRPWKSPVAGVRGHSSGAVSWAGYQANLTELIIQGGSRRGAQMIGMADWHPDIIEFTLCKIQHPYVLDMIIREIDDEYVRSRAEYYLIRDENGKPVDVRDKHFMTGANISVLVSHDLMEAVRSDGEWTLRFPDLESLTPEQKEYYNSEWDNIQDVRKWEEKGLPSKVYHTIKAKHFWRLINIAARFSAEPGMIFIDWCNDQSNSWYYAPLIVTNPCGEQPLPAWGTCNLIAINLERMYNPETKDVNWELLGEVTEVSQRFADNVIDLSPYHFEENERMAKNERRVGKGEMGLADLMIYMELPYGSEEMLKKTDEIFSFIAEKSYLASCDIAEEKGSFPLFDADKYLQSGYVKKLPQSVQDTIREKGIRNVCSLTIAPTGSTGSMVGVGTGVEPFFAFEYYRSGRLGEMVEIKTPIAQKYFEENPEATELPEWYVTAQDLTPEEHVRVQATIQYWVDSAISKTANAPSTFTVEDNEKLYMMAWELGCKGVTVYVDGSRDTQVLMVKKDESSQIEEVQEEQLEDLSEIVPSEEWDQPSAEDMTMVTMTCRITKDEAGNIVRECT